MSKKSKYSAEEKLEILMKYENNYISIAELCRIYEISDSFFYNELIKKANIKAVTKDETKKVLISNYNDVSNDIENLKLNIGFAKKEITVQQVSNEDRKYLDLEDFNMIVVVKSYTYLDDTSLFQYTESRHRPDKFRFVDFARRKNL